MSIVDEVLKENELYSDGKVSYVKWLMSLVEDERVSAGQRLSYNKLLWRLWRIEYVPSFGNDDDRAIEGLELRNRYLSSLGENIGIYIHDDASNDVERMWGKCRVLEMLIALSTRMYDLMQDLGVYNSVSRWFWEIMNRVGFDILDDDHWDTEGFDSRAYVTETCEHIMNRDGVYTDGDSRGGWFWIVGWENMEVWYQMHAYLSGFFK